ncbi:hypothetical protein K1719_000561 [Acacia pycnantha]|nr:hypothetical protein K1719_000561 [Acacia pycnantha]
MAIVDLLLECMELSNRPNAGSVRLKEDIHNTHGYKFLVQFSLTLSKMATSQGFRSFLSNSFADQDVASDRSQTFNDGGQNYGEQENATLQGLSPPLSRFLDVLVCLAQTGSNESI